MGVARPGTWTLDAFVDKYTQLRNQGLTYAEIGEAMRLKRKSVERNVSRARKAGLLPPFDPRAQHEFFARWSHLAGRGKQP